MQIFVDKLNNRGKQPHGECDNGFEFLFDSLTGMTCFKILEDQFRSFEDSAAACKRLVRFIKF